MSDQKLTAQLNNIISPMLFAKPDARNLNAIRMLMRFGVDKALGCTRPSRRLNRPGVSGD